jgi:hypothetical protein
MEAIVWVVTAVLCGTTYLIYRLCVALEKKP